MKAVTRIFLSYAAADAQIAQELADGLRRHSFDVWTTHSSLGPGDNFAAQLADALGKSDAMVVLLTPKSVESEWVRREIEYALSSARFEQRLVPVVIGGESTRGESSAWLDRAPWVLKRLHLVSSPTPAKASQRVAEVLKKTG
jgi:hypothetical protein